VRKFAALFLVFALAGCQTPEGGVANKVLADFGLKDRPESYESGSDQVADRLDAVGATEIKRLNMAGRQGEIKFEQDGIRGQYYKEAKVYEDYSPLDAQIVNRSAQGDRGYVGYVQYRYQIYQSARGSNKAEAMATVADIPTGDSGQEVYRYSFGPTGVWDGAKGEITRR